MEILINKRGGSSVGRATGLHPVGRRFDSYSLHQFGHPSSEAEQWFCKPQVLGSNPRGGSD
tara:strand:+ start:633 stop:815 length:183 start_codon:yes stop_codon:yes gene_type:complete